MPLKEEGSRKDALFGRLLFYGFLIVPFFLGPSLAHAHRVYLFAWMEGDTVHAESYFPHNKPVKKGLIKVFDLSGKELLQGKTDEKGALSFKVPQKGDLRLVLEAAMGHRAEYLLKVADAGGVAVKGVQAVRETGGRAAPPPLVQVRVEQLREVVEEALDVRMRPVIRALTQIQKQRGPRITDVIAGIGYIFGLAGILFYFKARKRR